MANNLYMPFHPGDYLTDTAHLSAAEHGAYFLLILNYWQRGEALPMDDRKLRGIARMTADEWAASRETVLEFFDERNGALHHKRIDEELERARAKSEKARENGRRSAGAKRPLNERSTNAQRPLSDRSTNQEQVQDQVTEGTSVPSDADPREADFRSTISRVYAKHGHLPPETGTAVVWLKHGRDPAICCAVIDDHLAKKRKKLPLSYFEGPIADAHAPPRAGEARPPPGRKSENGWATMFRKSNGLGEFANERDHESGQDWAASDRAAITGG